VICVTSQPGREIHTTACCNSKERHAMRNRTTDLGKQHQPPEGLRDDLNAELSEEELSNVSGGKGPGGHLFSACVSGQHFKKASLN
jgi:bacteriocin-like protein